MGTWGLFHPHKWSYNPILITGRGRLCMNDEIIVFLFDPSALWRGFHAASPSTASEVRSRVQQPLLLLVATWQGIFLVKTC